MPHLRRLLHPLSAAALALAGACTPVPGPGVGRGPPEAAAQFVVPDSALPVPMQFIAYGDMRFTAPSETGASLPAVRRALVARIAAERPAALFLTGDLPWRGGTPADYEVYRDETRAWREQGLRVFPALGNHEFAGCDEAQCLERWWTAFPELRGRRWYAVALGAAVRAIALDSDVSLLEGSPQRAWLEAQIAGLPHQVRFVLVWLHHPPVADLATGEMASHNPRPNEVALAAYLAGAAARARARFVVVAGHTHNYERFEQDGIAYLVSGGGGARPYPVERTPLDLYRGGGFPNFHYLRFTLRGSRLEAEMVRVEDPDAAAPGRFEVRDRFAIDAR